MLILQILENEIQISESYFYIQGNDLFVSMNVHGFLRLKHFFNSYI